MATRRHTLRSRVSVSAREEEAQLDDLPKVQQPQSDALHCNPVTRSMSKKVEQTPSRTNQHGDRTSVAEDISPRRSWRIMGTQKSPAALRLKEEAQCGTPLSQEDNVNGNSTLTENHDVPKLQLTEIPAARSEKEVQKPILRKSMRIAKLQNPYSSVNVDSNCLGGSGTEPEEHMDESCEPAVVKQNEVRSPKNKGKTKAIEVDQENLEMAKVSSQSPHVPVSSPVPESETLSVEPKCNSELHGESKSGDAAGTESKPSYSDKEMQTVIWKIIIGAEEELKAHDPETKDRLLLQDASPSKAGAVASSSPVKVRDDDSGSPRKSGNAGSTSSSSPRKARNTTTSSPGKDVDIAGSHRKSRESAVKDTSPVKTWNLRSKSLRLGSEKQEEKAEAMEAECSGEALPEPESQEDRTDVEGSVYLPLGPECGELTDDSVKKPVNGEKPVSHTNVNNGENDELLSKTTGNRESVGECAQFAGGIGTLSANMAPVTKPDDFRPSASKEHLENVSPGKCINLNVQVTKAIIPETCISKREADGTNVSRSHVLETEAAQTNMLGSVISAPESGGTILPDVAISELEAEESNLPESAFSELEAEGRSNPESKVSKPEGGRTDMPGSPTSIAEGRRSNCAGSFISGPEAGQLNLPKSTISETEAERKPHCGLAVSKPEDRGTNHAGCTVSELESGELNCPRSTTPEPGDRGSFQSEMAVSEPEVAELISTESEVTNPEAERKTPPKSAVSKSEDESTNAPGSATPGDEGKGSNCAESPISRPESRGSSLPGFSVFGNEPDPCLKLQIQQKHKLVSLEISSMSQQESECQCTDSGVQSSGTGRSSLHLSLDELDTYEFKNRGIGFGSMENLAHAEETAADLNISEDSVALEPAESVEEQVSVSVNCSNMATPEMEGDSVVTFIEPSSWTQTEANVSDVIVELPMVSGSKVQPESSDQNGTCKLQDLQEEQTTYTSNGDNPPTLTSSENQEESVHSKTRKRKRGRGRRKKYRGTTQTDCTSGHIDVSAARGPLDGESTVPLLPVSAVICSVGTGANELRREELQDDTIDISNLEVVGWDQPEEGTENHVLLNNEEKVETEPLTTSVESLAEKVTDEQEIEKAEVKEADKITEEANDNVAEIPEELGHETEAKPVGKQKKTTKSGHQLIVSNLDSSKTYGELQIAVIRFFMEKQLSVTSIGIRKSRKRGLVTFLTRKDLIQALKSNGEELLGRTLQLRRPEQIEKPLATDHGKKRKLKELDQDSTVSSLTKKKKIQKLSVLNKKNKKYSAFLTRKRMSQASFTCTSTVVSPKKSRRNSLTPVKKEKMIQAEKEEEPATPALQKKKKKKKTQEEGEKKEQEEPFAPPSLKKKRKLEGTVLDEREDKSAVLQKKNKNKLEKAVLNEEREEDKEDAAPPKKKKKKHQEKAVLNDGKEEGKEEASPQPKKKKKKNQEKVALNGKREEEKVHAEPLKMGKKKYQSKTSWCLYLQNIGFQEKKSKIKAAIGNFLNERSISYKEIVLHPSRFSACIELHSEEDLNKAMKLDACKTFGQAVRPSKVAKLGALDVEGQRTLYIRSLPSEVSARNLKKLFKKVAGVWIQENQKSSKRFALIAFKTTEAADGALSKSEIECKGNLIQLQSVHQRSKERKKILMVRNLPCPLSKVHLKALFTDAKDIRIPEENESQAQGIAYIEYKTAKQAKAALKQFREKGVQGQVVRIDSIAGKNERPEKCLLQKEKIKRQEKKIAEAKQEGDPEKKLPGQKKKSKKCKTDLSPPPNSLLVWNLPSKVTLDGLKSTFKGSIGAEIHSSKM